MARKTGRGRAMFGGDAPIGHKPWKGVNLGGWLLLEPGPTGKLFWDNCEYTTKEMKCEWSLMKVLHKRKDLKALARHREAFITKKDFEEIRQCGLNAVRLPFGYWVLLGPEPGDPYVGPAIEYVDRAVAWAEEVGLQILLDLHGAPGGESGDAPCGHHLRPPEGTWHWRNWNFRKSLEALKFLAERYKNSKAVTGIAVCNEPSNKVPARTLCRFYDRAVSTIRGAGMHANKVSITLPCFQRDLAKFAKTWMSVSKGQHKNICFDLHHYYCFGNRANGRTLAQHIRLVEARGRELLEYPAVIGEWSLALGHVALSAQMPRSRIFELFAKVQMKAYRHASHGSFFWNWKDHNGTEWSYRWSHEEGLVLGALPKLPSWSGDGHDPLEEKLEPAPQDPKLCFGDLVYLRAFNGKLWNMNRSAVEARWGHGGLWQQFVLCPNRSGKASPAFRWGSCIVNGDTVRLMGHNGNFVSLKDNTSVVASCRKPRNDVSEFTLQWHWSRSPAKTVATRDEAVNKIRHLQHRDRVYLRSNSTSCFVEANQKGVGLSALAKKTKDETNAADAWQKELAGERRANKRNRDAWRQFSVERVVKPRLSKVQGDTLIPRLLETSATEEQKRRVSCHLRKMRFSK